MKSLVNFLLSFILSSLRISLSFLVPSSLRASIYRSVAIAPSVSLLLIITLSTPLLISCATDDDPLGIKNKSASEIYTEAQKSLQNKTYDKSIKLYNALETTYPYGIYAQQGLLDIAYAYYEYDNYQSAISSLDDFITTYSTSTNMDYALYLKGYINYQHSDGFFDKYTKQDPSELEVSNLKEAHKIFTDLITIYPNSKYTPDAKMLINQIIEDLAKSEIIKTHYYMVMNEYIASINHANEIITNYSTTSFVEESLAIEIVAYDKLGNIKLSNETKEVLLLNYPNSRYLKKPWVYKNQSWYQIF